MKRAPFALLALVATAPTFGKEPAPDVTFVSPCECIGFHGVHRWVTKTDQAPVPSDKTAIQSMTTSHTRQQIIQTDDIRQKITLCGKFIP